MRIMKAACSAHSDRNNARDVIITVSHIYPVLGQPPPKKNLANKVDVFAESMFLIHIKVRNLYRLQ